MACIINASASSVSSFRITDPVTQTKTFDGDWEGAIDVTVQSAEFCDEAYIEQWDSDTSTWNNIGALTSADGYEWMGSVPGNTYANPLRFRAQGIDYAGPTYTSPEVIITYTTPTVAITTPTDGFTWARGDNYFEILLTNATAGWIGVGIDGGVEISTFSPIGGGVYAGFGTVADGGAVTFIAYLNQGSFAFNSVISAGVSGTVT